MIWNFKIYLEIFDKSMDNFYRYFQDIFENIFIKSKIAMENMFEIV